MPQTVTQFLAQQIQAAGLNPSNVTAVEYFHPLFKEWIGLNKQEFINAGNRVDVGDMPDFVRASIRFYVSDPPAVDRLFMWDGGNRSFVGLTPGAQITVDEDLLEGSHAPDWWGW